MSNTLHKHRGALPHANEAFIKRAAAAAQISETCTGVPASVTIAQAIIESGWGKSHIGTANNYFGVKAQTKHGHINVGSVATGYKDALTTEYLHHQKVKVTAHFRSYASMSDSFVDHGLFLKGNRRYAPGLSAYAASGDADAFATHLQKVHYATDPHYASLLISMMKRHNLYQYNLRPKGGADKSKD